MKAKTCPLDPLPTQLLKECVDSLIPILLKIVNLSITTSNFPDALKLAIIIPLLKKILLNIENKKNYRPVSNLAFLGKVIEKSAISRYSEHVTMNDLEGNLQSAYKEKHSVETALLAVMDDLLMSVDARNCVLLTLLDYSAAFDTVSHPILFERFSKCYGITNEALDWLKSYLTNRRVSVSVNNILSDQQPLSFGLPQGSLIGPFAYPKYAHPIAPITKIHNVHYHQYADDTQLYIDFDPKDPGPALTALEHCLRDVKSWSIANMLKLNDDKTEFLVVSSKTSQSLPSIDHIRIGDECVQPVDSARNIGVVIDKHLTMAEQVSSVCKACYVQIRTISRVRRFLSQEATESLVNALVTSRLDNCNSLLYGLPDYMVRRLQKIQNHAAKLIVQKKKSDHVTPILYNLHWLPISYRIQYKVLLLTFKCYIGDAPQYLTSRIAKYEPRRSLRSGDSMLLVEKTANMKSYGERAFSVCGPKLWNALPLDLRKCETVATFKGKLKTHLFKMAFT